MASLSDIFNPSLLIFLGILVLVALLLVVYIESKNREQNHKIASMFSLVSSLAEELNIIKNNVTKNEFILHNGGSDNLNYTNQNFDKKSIFINKQNDGLIPVSDDEDSDDEASDDDSDDEDSDDDASDDASVESEELEIQSLNSSENLQDDNNFTDVKFLKLNINNSLNETIVTNDIKNLDEIDELDELDDQSIVSSSLISSEKESLENTKEKEKEKEILDISSSDLKTININLEESKNDNIDYKKLSLTKLKSVVAEKGLSNETSKLKKADLLKLLGVE